MYQERFYRDWTKSAYQMEAAYKESDLLLSSDKELSRPRVLALVEKYYRLIEDYAASNHLFATSLSPIDEDPQAPVIIQDMIKGGRIAGVGPFACVAGAVAAYVGGELLNDCGEIIVENGGDIFLRIASPKKVGVYLGEGFSADTLVLNIKNRLEPFGIASSSAKLGPSLSFGRADLAMIIASDAIVADGFATTLGNKIKTSGDAALVMESFQDNPFIQGILVAVEGKVFMWGDIEIADDRK
jgi:uncharacterized protein